MCCGDDVTATWNGGCAGDGDMRDGNGDGDGDNDDNGDNDGNGDGDDATDKSGDLV